MRNIPLWIKRELGYYQYKEWECLSFGKWKQFVIVFNRESARGKVRMKEVTIRYFGKIAFYHYKVRYV